MPVRFAVIGSRNHSCLQDVDASLDHFLGMVKAGGETLEIQTAEAPGVNEQVKQWCARKGVPCNVIPLDWTVSDEVGGKATAQIVENTRGMIVFWDGRSENTLDTIVRAKRLKDYKVVVNVR